MNEFGSRRQGTIDSNEIAKLKESFIQKEDDYKNQIARLEAQLITQSSQSQSQPLQSKPKSEMSWLDDDIDAKPFHSTLISSQTNPSSVIKSLEDQIAKEKIANRRLQSDIDRLTQQMKSCFINSSINDDISKYIKEINTDQIQVKAKIGQGGFSTIYQASWNNSIDVAVKEIFDPNITTELMNEFNNEIKMLFLVRHPNIISLYGISKKDKKLTIITELAPRGSLFDYLYKSNDKEMDIDFKKRVISQLISVMKYIHENGLVHRDLKSQNILFDEQMNVKLCDFGLMKPLSELNSGSGQFAGTPNYMAPEILSKAAYSEKIDQFAFGTIIWELFVKKIPYYGCDPNEIKNKLSQGEMLNIPKSIPASIGEIINKCRDLNPNARPSFQELSQMKLG